MHKQVVDMYGSRRNLGQKLIAGVCTAALALSMAPAAAFAAAGHDSTGGWFDLPTARITSFEHSDANGGYSYLSSGIERVVGGFSQSMYYLMGINGVNFDRAIRPTNQHAGMGAKDGKLITDAVNAAAGIMGTSVNVQPDEYLWNSCYRLSQGVPLGSVAGEEDEEVYIWSGAGNPSTYPTVAVSVHGAEYAMPNVIYYEANFISDQDTEWTKSKSVSEWVKIENARAGRPHTAEYDPYIASWETASGGIYYGADLMYKLAAEVDNVNAESKGALVSRYVNRTGENAWSKYASATALAQNYENFAKATQLYMVKYLADNPSAKKTVAIVCGYQPAKDGQEAAYAVRILDPAKTGDMHDSANYGGRLANSMMNFVTDFNEVAASTDVAFAAATDEAKYVNWYPASVIAEKADAIFVCDAPYGNDRAFYLATNQDGQKASIYTVDNNTYDPTNENVKPLVDAVDAAGSADLFYKYPNHLFGVWYAQGFENCWMGPIAASLLYPTAFSSVENVMAYAEKNFWHINSADINGVLQATCADISLPKGKTLGTPSSNYQNIIDGIMADGVAYYNANKEAVAKINGGDLVLEDTSAIKASDAKQASEVEAPALSPAEAAGAYRDVAASDWVAAEGWLGYVTQSGLMGGSNGNFFGNDALTRGQVATILYRYAQPSSTATTTDAATQTNATRFADNLDGQYYTAAVNWAANNGILTGDSGANTVRPNGKITRQELAVMLYRFATFAGADVSGNNASAIASAPDAATVASWATNEMGWCVKNGVLSGIGNTGRLAPTENATRSQMAKMATVVIRDILWK